MSDIATQETGLTPDATVATAAASRAPSAPAAAIDTVFYSIAKRLFDVVAACCGLALCVPLWALIAAAIKLNSPGPVIFRQQRPGKDGRPFRLLKFRSMCKDAHTMLPQVIHLNVDTTDPLIRIPNDPRVTRVGRWLRATSLDETPQVINILKGEMSLVGPRPIARTLDDHDPRTQLRLAVRPGLTGLWQASGRKQEGCDFMLEKDMEYLRNRSFWYDAKIVLKTVRAVLQRSGAW